MNRKLSNFRERAGLTQAEVAQLVGVSENTIANWEKGGAAKWIRNLNNLCKALNCKLEDLSEEDTELDKSQLKLTPNILETVRQYCEALAKHDKKAVISILSFATLHDRFLRYWLDQADEKIKQFKESSEERLDIELIVNSLILQNLSQELSLILPSRTSKESSQHVRARFNELVNEVHLSPEFLRRYTCFNVEHYCRKLILQNNHLCVYVIGWEPGQQTEGHHHGNSLDAIRLVRGEMNHAAVPPEVWEKTGNVCYEGCFSQEDLPVEDKVIFEGEQVIIDRRHAHQIKNLSGQRLVTLHFRFGTPPEDGYWDQKEEEEPIVSWSQVELYQIMPGDRPYIL